MKRLVSTLNLPKEDWLRYRKCGITGTDAGAILGLNPYRSAFQVYHDKISDTIENIDNEAMRQGRDLEDYVAQRFSEETGFNVRRANAIYQSEEHPLLLADFGRLIVGQKAGLECKTVSPFSADKWADGKIPAYYMAQVNHYLAVSGFDCWYIAALIFGKELVIHKIISDKAVLDNLIAEEEHGHQYLVETAAAACDTLHLFVVSEDASLVPFAVRKRLVAEGVKHLPNVILHDSGPYIISNATFPSYFLKDEAAVIDGHARLDLAVFTKIAKALNITARYVGEEPTSQVTGLYNQIMCEQLPQAGIDCIVVPRKEANGKAISASTVRQCLQTGDWATLETLLPQTSLDYFRSPEAEPVLARIRSAGNVVHY